MKLGREYERFRGGPNLPAQERLHISLQSGRKLYLNSYTYRLLGRPAAVYLYFCREKDEIAIEATSPRLAEAFPVRPDVRGRGFMVHIAPFVSHFGIRIDGTHRFIDPVIDQHGILHLKLSNIVQTSRGERRRR